VFADDAPNCQGQQKSEFLQPRAKDDFLYDNEKSLEAIVQWKADP